MCVYFLLASSRQKNDILTFRFAKLDPKNKDL